jgi:hypothetical protein
MSFLLALPVPSLLLSTNFPFPCPVRQSATVQCRKVHRPPARALGSRTLQRTVTSGALHNSQSVRRMEIEKRSTFSNQTAITN